MLNFIFRIVSLFCLAIAMVAGVLDLTRSIANKEVVLTALQTDWLQFSPQSLALVREMVVTYVHPYVWTPVIETGLAAPSWAVFALLSLVFAFAVRSRKRRWQESFGA